jgi:hypothetical protein
MISNLDKCWEWHNEHTNESLSQDDFHDLMSFIDTLKAHDFASLVVGFDNIKWGEEQVNNGTYGYEKADGAYGLGRNYLSNSLIIGKTAENKSYTAYVSLEKRFRDLDIINQITESLGKIISEEVYFAPENKEEREEWNLKANEAKQKFDNAPDMPNPSIANLWLKLSDEQAQSLSEILAALPKQFTKNEFLGYVKGYKECTADPSEATHIVYIMSYLWEINDNFELMDLQDIMDAVKKPLLSLEVEYTKGGDSETYEATRVLKI